MRFKLKKSTAAILAFSMLTLVGSTIYAADYRYDELNRVTSVEKEGKTTTYTYDQGGNLLSATSTTSSSLQRSASSVLAGWTPYMTQGLKPIYETAAFGGTGDTPREAPVSVTESTYGGSANEAQWMTLSGPTRSGGANIYRDMTVQGGASYTYQGHLKTEQMKDAVAQVVVNYYDDQNRLIRHDNVFNVKQDTDWQSYNMNLIAPSDAATARVHLQIVLLKAGGQAKAGFADGTFVQEGGE